MQWISALHLLPPLSSDICWRCSWTHGCAWLACQRQAPCIQSLHFSVGLRWSHLFLRHRIVPSSRPGTASFTLLPYDPTGKSSPRWRLWLAQDAARGKCSVRPSILWHSRISFFLCFILPEQTASQCGRWQPIWSVIEFRRWLFFFFRFLELLTYCVCHALTIRCTLVTGKCHPLALKPGHIISSICFKDQIREQCCCAGYLFTSGFMFDGF